MSDDLERRTRPISFMVTPAQAEQLEAAAATEGHIADYDPANDAQATAAAEDHAGDWSPSEMAAFVASREPAKAEPGQAEE